LEDEGDEVASAEDEGVGPRFEEGEVLAVDNDDAREAEVDSCGKKGRSYGEANKIDKEVVMLKGVIVK